MLEKLKKLVIENKVSLPYINLNSENTYGGWVKDFHIMFNNGNKMWLDLSKENDMFLLFVLAVAWSRSGHWENAAYFVTFLKYKKYNDVLLWSDESFINRIKERNKEDAKKVFNYCKGINTRVKLSFRKDIYDSVHILANNWIQVKEILKISHDRHDYQIFIEYMRNLNGLGYGDKRMNIKILLILRELRCQKIFDDIPGKYCCVPDQRVKDACKAMSIQLPACISDTKSLIKASEILYNYFGDLYDIPPFAYEDLKEQLKLC